VHILSCGTGSGRLDPPTCLGIDNATRLLGVFISNHSMSFTEDQTLLAPFGFFGDLPPEACFPTLETVSSRDFRRPGDAIKNGETSDDA